VRRPRPRTRQTTNGCLRRRTSTCRVIEGVLSDDQKAQIAERFTVDGARASASLPGEIQVLSNDGTRWGDEAGARANQSSALN